MRSIKQNFERTKAFPCLILDILNILKIEYLNNGLSQRAAVCGRKLIN
jgi:hypothetical protein